MSKKIVINPLLIKALDHYASGSFCFKDPTVFIQEHPNGLKEAWTLEKTCAAAEEVLGNEELAYLKLKVLQAGMKKCGMEDLYEHIMGEKLP